MFEWWRERRRDKLLEQPFPAAQIEVLERNVKHYQLLSVAEQQHLRELVQVFVAEKSWEGCGGLTLTDEMKYTIAAQACLLVLALPHRLYENIESILVYPSTIVRPAERIGVFIQPRDLIAGGPVALFGEAHHGGPVILAWDRVLRDGKHPHDGHNLVYHEFAHKLDLLDGDADGTPPLASREERERCLAEAQDCAVGAKPGSRSLHRGARIDPSRCGYREGGHGRAPWQRSSNRVVAVGRFDLRQLRVRQGVHRCAPPWHRTANCRSWTPATVTSSTGRSAPLDPSWCALPLPVPRV